MKKIDRAIGEIQYRKGRRDVILSGGSRIVFTNFSAFVLYGLLDIVAGY